MRKIEILKKEWVNGGGGGEVTGKFKGGRRTEKKRS